MINEWLTNSTFLASYAVDSLEVSNNKLDKNVLPVSNNAAGNNSAMQQPNNLGGNSSNTNLGGNSSNTNLESNSSNTDPNLALQQKIAEKWSDAEY